MKKNQKAQSKRFIEKAKEIGADERPESFKRAFVKIVPPRKAAPKSASK